MKSNKSKILLFTAGFPPPLVGGSVEYVYNLANEMPPGILVIHTANTNKEDSKEMDKTFPQKIIRSFFINHVQSIRNKNIFIRKILSIREYIMWPLYAFWLILKERPNLIHIGEHNFAGIAALFAKKLLGIPFIYNTYAEEITMLSKKWLHNKIFSTIIIRANKVITVSDYTKNILKGYGLKDENIIKILPSVSKRKLRKVSLSLKRKLIERYKLKNCKIILTAGSLEKRKGQQSVLKILNSLKNEIPNIKYIIVGSGPNKLELKKLTENLKLNNHVIFTGKISDSELNFFYEICDLFVMPHRQLKSDLNTEGCPTVFLEASAYGKAVVGGNAGGVSDAIIHNKTGLIIDGKNEVVLLNSLLMLINNPNYASKLGMFGKKYTSKLSSKIHGQKLYFEYKKLIKIKV